MLEKYPELAPAFLNGSASRACPGLERALARLGTSASLRALQERTAHPLPGVRKQAVDALGLHPLPGALSHLERLLDGPDPNLRCRALQAMGSRPEAAAEARAAGFLAAEEGSLRRAAIRGLLKGPLPRQVRWTRLLLANRPGHVPLPPLAHDRGEAFLGWACRRMTPRGAWLHGGEAGLGTPSTLARKGVSL